MTTSEEDGGKEERLWVKKRDNNDMVVGEIMRVKEKEARDLL